MWNYYFLIPTTEQLEDNVAWLCDNPAEITLTFFSLDLGHRLPEEIKLSY